MLPRRGEATMSEDTLALGGVEPTRRVVAFDVILETGHAAAVEDIAAQLGLSAERGRQLVYGLAAIDCIRIDDAGSVVVAGGLSVASTSHRMSGPFGERFTCCAYDAL